MYKNRAVIDGLSNNFYWSSSEESSYSVHGVNFGIGYAHVNESKYEAVCVRAVRAF